MRAALVAVLVVAVLLIGVRIADDGDSEGRDRPPCPPGTAQQDTPLPEPLEDAEPVVSEDRADASSPEDGSYGGDFALEPTGTGHYAAEVDDPSGLPRKVTVLVTDEERGGDGSVRMQLNGVRRLGLGDEVWLLNEFFLPDDFPLLEPGGWLSLSSAYGPPGQGAGPNTIGVRNLDGRNEFTWTEEPGGLSILWEGRAATPGRWHVVVRHMRFHPDPDEGFMEIYYGERGQPLELQTLSGSAEGETQRRYATLLPGVNWDGESPNSLNISNYHRDDMEGWEGQVPIYFGSTRVFPESASLDGIERFACSG